MIEIKNICKDFPLADHQNRVLYNINLTINSSELTMLVGPSGCGKTTLLSIISGILSPSEGEVIIDKTSITKLSDHDNVEFRMKNLGFIFQQYNLLPGLSAAENAAIPLIAAGVKIAEAVEKAIAVLAKLEMKNHAEKLPWQLSGGQQQRVAIARALIHNPKVIVCDEPTAALDASTGFQVMEILKEISNEKTRSVLIVSHDDRVYKFASKIIKMEDGRVA